MSVIWQKTYLLTVCLENRTYEHQLAVNRHGRPEHYQRSTMLAFEQRQRKFHLDFNSPDLDALCAWSRFASVERRNTTMLHVGAQVSANKLFHTNYSISRTQHWITKFFPSSRSTGRPKESIYRGCSGMNWTWSWWAWRCKSMEYFDPYFVHRCSIF